jgi:hypothetical protein
MRGLRCFLTGLVGGAIALLVLSSGLARAAENKLLWLAVCKPDFTQALQPLAEKRRSDGFEVVLSNKPVEEALAASVRRPDFLLLVGDDEPGQEKSPWFLPAKRMKLYRWRNVQAREFASDAAWGDLDGDGVPDIPVGRIPARSSAQVELVVRKILSFESQPPRAADLQLTVWLGSPEYGAAINAMASGLGVTMIPTKGPPWLRPWFVSGNPSDPFCGWPPDQPARFTRQMQQGGVLSVLMGHASADAFYSMQFADKPIFYSADNAAGELGKGPPVPPMVFFSCESGDFTRPGPCQTKSLLFLPGGPVATIGATTESHPLTNYFSGACLLKSLGGEEKRLGAIWFRAQRQASQTRDFLMEMILRDAEGSLEKHIDVEKLRRDQMLMYALLGDPATRLRLPEPLQATVERTAKGWQWRAQRPPGATRLEVGLRQPQALPMSPGKRPTSAEEADNASERANACFAFTAQPSPPEGRPWEGNCDRPGWLRLVAIGSSARYVVVLKLE